MLAQPPSQIPVSTRVSHDTLAPSPSRTLVFTTVRHMVLSPPALSLATTHSPLPRSLCLRKPQATRAVPREPCSEHSEGGCAESRRCCSRPAPVRHHTQGRTRRRCLRSLPSLRGLSRGFSGPAVIIFRSGRGAGARTAGAPASANITASGTPARTAGARASASITARGATAATPACAHTAASGASAKSARSGGGARDAWRLRCLVCSSVRQWTGCRGWV